MGVSQRPWYSVKSESKHKNGINKNKNINSCCFLFFSSSEGYKKCNSLYGWI